MRVLTAAIALLTLAFAGTALYAEDYPARPIHLIVGFPPGSIADVSFRVISAKLSEKLGQPIIVEDRPGAGSGIAAAQAAHSPNDGYTLYVGSSANVFDQALQLNKNFDFYKDFTPIMLAASTPNILVVAPSLGIKTVSDLVSYAKSHPGKLSFASAGFGSAAHLSLELLKMATQADIVHVPYPGSPQVITDMLAGRVDGFFAPGLAVRGYIRVRPTPGACGRGAQAQHFLSGCSNARRSRSPRSGRGIVVRIRGAERYASNCHRQVVRRRERGDAKR